jgi:hypothetical protein
MKFIMSGALAASLAVVGCSTPSAVAAHRARSSIFGPASCHVVRTPTAGRGERPLGFEAAKTDGERAAWATAVTETAWWRARRARNSQFGLDPRYSTRVEMRPLRYRPGGTGYIVEAHWSSPGTRKPGEPLDLPKDAPHGEAWFYFDDDVLRNGPAQSDDGTLLWAQQYGDPTELRLDGVMVGDDGRSVLYGIERLRTPEQARRQRVDGYGWLAWFDGTSLQIARRTCLYDDPV